MKPHLELLDKLGARAEAQAFARTCPDLETAWNTCDRSDWMIWLLRELKFRDGKTYRLYACWCVRNTPLADGRKVWDLLTDPRSRNAVEVAERFAVGKATADELREARNADYAAYDAAYAAAACAASYAADAAACAAAYAVTYAAASYAADAAACASYAASYAADAAACAASYAADAAACAAACAAAYAVTYAAAACAASYATNAACAAAACAAAACATDARIAARKVQVQQLREMVPFAIVAELAK